MNRPLIVDRCACSGTATPIVRGSDDRLSCVECGADEPALIAYKKNSEILRQLPIQDLSAELERRTASAPDLGLSDQVCPRCSTASTEATGTFSRVEQLFRCQICGVVLHGLGYERALEDFRAARWHAKQASVQAAALGTPA